MLKVADTNFDGQISFEEFKVFLQTENQKLISNYQQVIRNTVADNIYEHGGVLVVYSKRGAKYRVNMPVDVELLRAGASPVKERETPN